MAASLVASVVAQAALLAGIAALTARAESERSVEVRIVPLRVPQLAAPPPPPPASAPATRASHPAKERKPDLTALVQPKVVPVEQLEPEPSLEAGAETGEPGGVPGGRPGGVVGGVPGGVVGGTGTAVAPPIPARPQDLEAVRARIAHTLRYPPRARDLGWEGRCVVEFVLLASGSVRLLRVIESSGRPLLDEAALAAVQRGVPFPPPGVDVLIRTPIAFRLD